MSEFHVVQWATGTIGRRALRSVIEHPDLELVGVHVHTPDKVGVDAGELCGTDLTGVVATGSIEDVLAAKPDCVLYMPRAGDVADLCRLLSAGINVVTTTGQFHHPDSVDPAVRTRVTDACRQGAASIHATGSSPGFISEAVPLVLLSIQRRLDRLSIFEFADLSQRPSPELLFDLMGFGSPVESLDPSRFSFAAQSFGPSLRLLADAIGLSLDDVQASGELATTRRSVDIAAGTLKPGTVAAQRVHAVGLRAGVPLLSFSATWYCTTEITQDWDLRPTGWHVLVEGDAPLDVDLRIDVPLERMAELSPGLTAHRAVNAVPFVCDAAPGIRTSVELPQLIPTLAR
jgi:2,4-diaminopentanoate dehydrogenase